MSIDYKDTLNLPKTDFPMKANLPVKEPELVKTWDDGKLYEKIIKKNKDNKKYILHDGPPYANGHIHFGHILNKVLKDIVVKYRNMSGHYAEYVPGWDCHGLPIELQVEKELGKKNTEIIDIRKRCKEYALEYVNIQRDEFKRLGVIADWENPYLTLQKGYEGTIVREFGKFVKNGSVYRGRKPVYWCASCETALAEAEVEYKDHASPSIYVKFLLDNEDLAKKICPEGLPVYAVIWTTTPWTIPSNLGIALNTDFDYVLVQVGSEAWILAEALLKPMMDEIGIGDYKVLRQINPRDLERSKFRHPLIDRDSLLVLGEHVTIESGTGCVHTAPGHGREDFDIGTRYGLPAFAPVDNAGKFTEECGLPYLVGIYVEKANDIVDEKLKEAGALVWEGKVTHSYPHCWRCKKPIIFRSTAQWFISLEKNELRKKSLDAIENVEWIPKWGKDRILGMVENRPDWCISRQRAWGVPIIVVRCDDCNEDIISGDLIDHVASIFDQHGSDSWFTEDVEKLLPENFTCPKCGGSSFSKENDIIDVWFESGVSFAAVIENSPEGYVPVDLYLEGSDQHRGWFHSALLTSIATREMAPYKAVLTHGFVVDAEGKKYSKSAKNYVPPDKILKASGAEILRLWVAAEDYRNDIRVSDEIVKRLTEAYRKIRNTCRFILGNINDFNPDKDSLEISKMTELDRWILHRLQNVVEKCRNAYESYQFHVIYHTLNEFCVVDLSSFYLDIVKDRLYCEKKDGLLRRSAQTAMWKVLDVLAKVMAPILSFTAEEIWSHIPSGKNKAESVFLAEIPLSDKSSINNDLGERWGRFQKVRSEATKILERARADKEIGNSLEAKLVIEADVETSDFLKSFGSDLPDLFIVSQVELGKASGNYLLESEELKGLKIAVSKASGAKCDRCWKYDEGVGKDAEHPTACPRCVSVVK